MGQQQLLLLVLGIVIVGIAILVGINAYSENSVKSNWDSLLQDALRIASDAQAWKSKPELFGGSPDDTKNVSADFRDSTGASIDFIDLSYATARVGTGVGGTAAGAANQCYQNLNGVYTVVGTATELTIRAGNVSNVNQVVLTVDGTLEADVNIDGTLGIKGGASTADGSDKAISDFVASTACTL